MIECDSAGLCVVAAKKYKNTTLAMKEDNKATKQRLTPEKQPAQNVIELLTRIP
jgi:ribulose kinase